MRNYKIWYGEIKYLLCWHLRIWWCWHVIVNQWSVRIFTARKSITPRSGKWHQGRLNVSGILAMCLSKTHNLLSKSYFYFRRWHTVAYILVKNKSWVILSSHTWLLIIIYFHVSIYWNPIELYGSILTNLIHVAWWLFPWIDKIINNSHLFKYGSKF